MFNPPDPTHIFLAKYFTKQNVINADDGKTYKWNEYVTFRCKPTEPRFNKYTTVNAGFQRAAPDSVFLETKWAGIPYNVGDYVEYRDTKYQIKSVKKDETKVNPQAMLWLKNNPNTYWVLELEEVKILDMQKGDLNNVK